MKELKLERILGLIGALIWASTVFHRSSFLMEYAVPRFILGVAPNFGVVWLLNILLILVYQRKYTKTPGLRGRFIILGGILLVLLLSEVVHHFFLNAPFDVWDMVASGIASLVLLMFNAKKQQEG